MSGCCCSAPAPDPRAPRLAAVILAAGYSSRMGEGFKPLLPVGGRSALARAIALFRSAGVAEIAVVVGHRADELAPVVRREGAACVVNPRYAEGMYTSAVAGIGALDPEIDACFLLPVDVPLVRPSTVRRLAASLRPDRAVLYPTFRGRRGHPPLIGRRLFAEILAGDGAGGLKRVLAAHAADADEVGVFDAGILLDMDTPEDYARLCGREVRDDCPTAEECAAILAEAGTPEAAARHGRAVAGVALRLARAVGGAADADLAVAGALLHDLAKGAPDHAAAGARMLEAAGFPAVAEIVARHGDPAVASGAPDAAAVVYLADKLVREEARVSLDARFRPALDRFADDPAALAAAARRLEAARSVAAAIEARACIGLDALLDGVSPLPPAAAGAEPGPDAALGTTESVCPVCLRRIPAARVAEGGDVFLRKTCPEHGDFKTVIWRGAPAYAAWGRAAAAPAHPAACATEADRGCPFDCGLCPEHRQQSCCVLVEVTQRCNLACPVCFASSGRAAPDPGFDEIAARLRALRETGRQVNIQLSGGEPTVRDDLPEIVALARGLGFGFVQANTNGLRLADDLPYLRRLKAAGLNCVFLQFDAVTDAAYRRIRGRDLLAVKERAIRNCAELDLGVVLVPVLVPGVNTQEIGDILDFAIARMPTVRTVHFQPVSYVGRFPHPPADRDRITIPEVLRRIEQQTGGRIRAADFRPGTAENPYCSFNGEFAVGPDGGIAPLHGEPRSGCCGEGGDDAAEAARRFVARRWAARAEPRESSCCGAGVATDSFDAFLETRRHTLCISGMAFQDAWTLDLDRLKQCYIHVALPDRHLVPLCAYNLSAIGGETLYARPGP